MVPYSGSVVRCLVASMHFLLRSQHLAPLVKGSSSAKMQSRGQVAWVPRERTSESRDRREQPERPGSLPTGSATCLFLACRVRWR